MPYKKTHQPQVTNHWEDETLQTKTSDMFEENYGKLHQDV